jgi:hypothetical protein
MSETAHITFQTLGEKVTSSPSSGIVDGEASRPKSSPPKDEEAIFGTPIEDRRPSEVHVNVHELDVKKKQVSQKTRAHAAIALALILPLGISRSSSSMVIGGRSVLCKGAMLTAAGSFTSPLV